MFPDFKIPMWGRTPGKKINSQRLQEKGGIIHLPALGHITKKTKDKTQITNVNHPESWIIASVSYLCNCRMIIYVKFSC
jgi:hypothetical protein